MPHPATQSMSGASYVAVVATEHMLVNYPAVERFYSNREALLGLEKHYSFNHSKVLF